jgi:hypothetical protein
VCKIGAQLDHRIVLRVNLFAAFYRANGVVVQAGLGCDYSQSPILQRRPYLIDCHHGSHPAIKINTV